MGDGGTREAVLTPWASLDLTETKSESCVSGRIAVEMAEVVVDESFEVQALIDVPEHVSLSNVSVDLVLYYASGGDASALFAIDAPVLTGIEDISGAGTVAGGEIATVRWSVAPTNVAGYLGVMTYLVGGRFSYSNGGNGRGDCIFTSAGAGKAYSPDDAACFFIPIGFMGMIPSRKRRRRRSHFLLGCSF